jgi:hypothetical protein
MSLSEDGIYLIWLISSRLDFVRLKIILDLLRTSVYMEARLIQIQERTLLLHSAQHLCIKLHQHTPPSLICATATSLWAQFRIPSSNLPYSIIDPNV